jgi:hypothetical protein
MRVVVDEMDWDSGMVTINFNNVHADQFYAKIQLKH